MTRNTDSYTTIVNLGQMQFDVVLYYEYEPADPGVRYYRDGSGCPPSPAQVSIYDHEVIAVWFPGGKTSEGVTMGHSWLAERGWLDTVRTLLERHIDENYDWYSDIILCDRDSRDDEPSDPSDDWDC